MELIITAVFVLGYACIALEHSIGINKSATALITGAVCWGIFMVAMPDKGAVTTMLSEHLGSVSEILFFLLGAMTIVELIDAHEGFQAIIDSIRTRKYATLLWIVCFVSFCLSAVLDNMTTSIVMVSLLRKLIPDRNKKLLFAGMVVISANAGGAWTPIGDVTTTMLWIGNQITVVNIIIKTFAASMVCMVVPLLIVSARLKGQPIDLHQNDEKAKQNSTTSEGNTVLWIGVVILIMVPVVKTITHLPPYIVMLFGLGTLWVVTELIHRGKNSEDKDPLTVAHALRKIDTPNILFFLGILLSVASLEATGQLHYLAEKLDKTIANDSAIVILIGLLSAVVDNVPLVAAAQGMYSLEHFPTDSYFWEFLAYTAGTGGSILIIGSAAGVAAMGIEKIDFFWYLKRIGWLALLGYFAGAATYILQVALLHT